MMLKSLFKRRIINTVFICAVSPFLVESEQWGNNRGVYCYLSLLDETTFFSSIGTAEDCAPFKLFTAGHAS